MAQHRRASLQDKTDFWILIVHNHFRESSPSDVYPLTSTITQLELRDLKWSLTAKKHNIFNITFSPACQAAAGRADGVTSLTPLRELICWIGYELT